MRRYYPSFCAAMIAVCAMASGQTATTDTVPVESSSVVVVGLPGQTYPVDAIVIPAHVKETISIGMSANQSLPRGDKSAFAQLVSAAADDGLIRRLEPWHLKVAFQEFDEDGDEINAGTFEERWAGEKKDVVSYSSGLLQHTDYSTEDGVYRSGDPNWPNRLESQIRSLIVEPFAGVTPLKSFRFINETQQYDGHSLECKIVLAKFGNFAMPHSYCFVAGSNALRYRQGPSWDQVTYNDIEDFDGLHIARSILLADGGVRRLKLTVISLERLSSVDETMFQPPHDAAKLGDEILTGVQERPDHVEPPQWPSSASDHQFTVTVEVVVGLDGRVESAKAISGPAEFYKAAEKAAAKWTFKPYLIQGKAAKVMLKIDLSNS
jgi:hypothetical protein